MKICEKCNKEHNGSFASGRFCSRSCANRKIHSEETKLKIGNSVKNSEKFKINNKIAVINRLEKISKKLIPQLIKKESEKNISPFMIEKECVICKKIFLSYKKYPGKFCSHKCVIYDQQHGFKFLPKIKGGYREGSGRSKSGWYKGIFCNSTYELVWVIYNLDHNIQFSRNNQGFEYTYNNQKLKYYPDFIQNNGYIEIKGFLRPNDKEKFKQFPHSLIILYKNDIKYMFKYIKEKYKTVHFEELYEGNPHNRKINKCLICGQPAQFKFCSRKCAGLNVSKIGRNSIQLLQKVLLP